MNPYLLEMEVKERRRELLEEAGRQHMVALFNARYQTRTDKLLLAVADLLIRAGERLRRRHGHSPTLDNEFCRE